MRCASALLMCAPLCLANDWMLMNKPAYLRVDYLPSEQLLARPGSWWQTVLGVVPLDRGQPFATNLDIPVAPVPLRELGATSSTCEVWRTPGPLQSGHSGELHYRASAQVLFGRLVVTEPAAAIGDHNGPTALQQITAQAYARLFATLDSLGHPNLLRIWNYLAQINATSPQGERYHEFNSARRQAFLRAGRTVEGQVPAASALGSEAGSPLVIYFLASASAARSLENPRQVSAFRYPAEYGSDSPTFSRAAIANGLNGNCLFISGTASILGHGTVHVGNVAAQTRESIANIAALAAEANQLSGANRYAIEALQYKVYLRHAAEVGEIRHELAQRLPSSCPITYLQADICRRDLLVEIEAVGSPAPASNQG